jgi:ABC-2 type transport system ATP-binding protein
MDRALDVEIEVLSKYFGSFCAVDKMNFNVKHGEVFGLLGPNGAGKSTLIRMLTTLVTPSSGHARVNGFDVVQNPNGVRQSIGVIPQAMTSDLDLTAWENMTIFAKLYGLSPQKRKTAIHDLLGAVNLLDWADKPVKTFSGGMRRRMLSTHYMDEADKLCDRIAIVDHGKLVALDSPLKLKTSIPGTNTIEVSFSSVPADWQRTLESLPDVATVKSDDGVYRLSSNNGPRTVLALMDAVHAAGISVASLSVQSTTLDHVFVHYTGHDLRDAAHKPNPAESRFIIRR